MVCQYVRILQMRSKWLNVCVIILTAILWAMQMIPEQQENEMFLLPFLRQYKYRIALVSFIAVVSYHLYDIAVERDKIQKKWIKKFLQHIVYLDLGGNNYHTRVSVLRVKKGYQLFIRQVWYLLIMRFLENFKDAAWIRSVKQLPIHLFSDYLYVYQRCSYPKEKKSYTCFRVKENNGVAVKCYTEGVDCEVMTNCIAEIDLPDKLQELTSGNKRSVKKYMHDSYIDENNYSSLLAMVKRANNIYATPIINEQQHVWGVLIIDNDEPEVVSFKEKIEPVIERYIKIFVFTISHLKMK